MVVDTKLDFISSIANIEDVKQMFNRTKQALQLIANNFDALAEDLVSSRRVFYHMQNSSATLGLTALSLKMGDVAVTASPPQLRIPYAAKLAKISWCINHGTATDPGDWLLRLWQVGAAVPILTVPVSLSAVSGAANSGEFVPSTEIMLSDGSLWYPDLTGNAVSGMTAQVTFVYQTEM